MKQSNNRAEKKRDFNEDDVEIPDVEDTLLDDVDDDVDDDAAIEVELDEKKSSFKAGEVPDGQLDATRLYLSEIGFSALLTAEEEVFYSRLARKGDESGRKK